MNAFAQDSAITPEIEQLRNLTEIGRALTYTTTLEQVARLTVERGASLLGADAAVLMLADAEGTLRLRADHGVSAEALKTMLDSPDDLVGRLPELLDVSDEQLLAVPLVVAGAVTGLLAVALPSAMTAADEWLLSALADQAAVALEHGRFEDEVRPGLEGRIKASEGATSDKDRALATLAHDIRSPLGAIDGYCWNMEDELYGPITDAQRRVLTRVRLSATHLLSLLETVMEMARLNAGAGAMTLTPMSLAEVAQESVDMMMPASSAKLQRLTHVGDRSVMVLADRARLRQVLVNLLGNALKFTGQSGRISVVTGLCTHGDETWGEVRIIDNGPGIAAAERTAVFEPYYRAPDASRAPGIGLGLAISQALMVQMGGELALESEVGVGSSFMIRLPCRQVITKHETNGA